MRCKLKGGYISYYAGSYDRDINDKKVHLLLHRFIMNAPDDKMIDHIDGDTFNTRKSNMRICERKDNSKNRKINKNNTSGHKGVCWDKSCDKWITYIYLNTRTKNLGYYDNYDDAVAARETAEEKYFGEFNRKIIEESKEEKC